MAATPEYLPKIYKIAALTQAIMMDTSGSPAVVDLKPQSSAFANATSVVPGMLVNAAFMETQATHGCMKPPERVPATPASP